jgi:hypothetical protein
MLVGASAVLRVSPAAGVVALGVVLMICVGFVAFGKDTDGPDTLPPEAWLFGATALVPTISFTLTTIQPIQDWALPAVLVAPASLGAAWILINLKDLQVAGLKRPDWRGLVWSLAAVPIVGALAVSGLGASDMYFGASGGVAGPARILVLAFTAVAVVTIFYGLIQGPAELLIGRAAVPWVALVFASTFASSWPGLVFLLILGLVLGLLRSHSASIWPGSIAAVVVFVGLITL